MEILKEYDPKKVQEAFQAFVSKKIPVEADLTTLRAEEVVMEVFMYQPERDNKLIAAPDENENSRYGLRPYPVAKVLAVGSKVADEGYSVGDFVRLRDSEVGFVVNPAYQAWTQTYQGGNLKPIGQTPPAFLSNFGKMFGQSMYSLRPFDDVDSSKNRVYLMHLMNLHGRIKDIRTYMKVMFNG